MHDGCTGFGKPLRVCASGLLTSKLQARVYTHYYLGLNPDVYAKIISLKLYIQPCLNEMLQFSQWLNN